VGRHLLVQNFKCARACPLTHTYRHKQTKPRTDRPTDTARQHNDGMKIIFFFLGSLKMSTWNKKCMPSIRVSLYY